MNTNDSIMILFIILDGILALDLCLRVLHLIGPCCKKKDDVHIIATKLIDELQ